MQNEKYIGDALPQKTVTTDFLKVLQKNIAKAVVAADTLSPEGIQARIDELQKELLKCVDGSKDYNAVAEEILRLQKQKKQSESDDRCRDETMKRIGDLQDFIGSRNVNITDFDETLVKRLISQIAVYGDRFTVEFKSGVSVEISE